MSLFIPTVYSYPVPTLADIPTGEELGTVHLVAENGQFYRKEIEALENTESYRIYPGGASPFALASEAVSLVSPHFTGVPTAPTAALSTNTTQIATTAFVIANAVSVASPAFTGVPTAPTAAVDTNTTQLATTAFVIGQAYAKLASPTFSGTPSLPTGTTATTQSALDSTTKLATTAFVTTADNLKANLASPTFSGTPSLPTGTTATTQSALDSTTKLATTAFVTTADNLKANLASPTFTGTPLSTTAAVDTNTTQIATTAYVTTGIANAIAARSHTNRSNHLMRPWYSSIAHVAPHPHSDALGPVPGHRSLPAGSFFRHAADEINGV